MEEDPLAPSETTMILPLSSDFVPKLDDHDDYMELVWENGQILTRGRRSTQTRTTSLFDFYETVFDQVLEQNIGNGSDKNLGDTQVVPVRENPASNAKSPPCLDGALPEESDKSTKEKTESLFFKPQAVAIAADNKDVAMEVEPKTDPGLPEHELLENLKESDVSKNKKGVESMLTANGLRAMADPVNQKKTVEFSPPDAQSAAIGRSREMVGMGDEEKKSFDLLGWSTELCSESLSMCSPGTSEDPLSSLRISYVEVESEGSTYLSSNSDDRSEDVRGQVRARTRKRRSADFDDLSERERRHEINKRMRALQKLLPNPNKEDKASLLDEAIKYMTSLQLQLHMMSMRNGLVAPSMMLQMAPYSLVGMGIDMTQHFLPSLVPGAALHGISDAFHMPGFPNQPGLVPMSHSSFSDQTEVSSHQSAPAPSVPEAASSCSDDQETVDKPSENVKKENPEHLDGQAGK